MTSARFRGFALTAVAVTVAAITSLAWGLTRLRVDSSVEALTVRNDEEHEYFDRMRRTFGNDETILIGVRFSDATSPTALASLRAFTNEIETLEQVLEVEGIANIDDPVLQGSEILIQPLVPDPIDARASAWVRDRLDATEIYRGTIVSDDRQVALITVRLGGSGGDEGLRARLIGELKQAAGHHFDAGSVFLGGHPFMKVEIGQSMQRDLVRALPIALAVMLAILWMALRSLPFVLVGLAVVACSIAATLGLMGWLDRPLTAVTNVVPPLLLALSTAYTLHVLTAIRVESGRGGDSADVVRRALSHVWRPSAMAGLTSVIGFGVQAFSSIPAVRDFGFFLACGVGIATVLGFTLAAGVLSLVRLPQDSVQDQLVGFRRPLWRMGRMAANRTRLIHGAAVVCAGLSAFGITRLIVDSSGPSYFRRDSEFRRGMDFFARHFGGDVIENVYLHGPPGAFEDPEYLNRLLALQKDLEALPEVGRAISVADWMRETNRAFVGTGTIPGSRDAVAQLMLLYESSARPGALADLHSADGSTVRIHVLARVPSSSASRALRKRMLQLAERYFPRETTPYSVVSTEMLLSKASDVLAVEQTKGLLASAGLILALLFLQLGWRDGLLATPPNVLPVAMILGAMGIFGVTLNVATALIASAALGIAVDDTLHFMERVRRSAPEWGGRQGAMLEAMLTVGRPVVFAWAAVTAGYLVLALSDFAVVRDLGVLMAVCMTLCLFADLFLLPALVFSTARKSSVPTRVELDYGVEKRRAIRVQVREPVAYMTQDQVMGWGWTEDISQEGARVLSRDGPLPRGEVRLLWLKGKAQRARGRVVRTGPRDQDQGREFSVTFDLVP